MLHPAMLDLSMRMHYWNYKEYFPVISTGTVDTALDKTCGSNNLIGMPIFLYQTCLE